MVPLCKIATWKNNDSVVRCQIGRQNGAFYLIWLGTPHSTPRWASAIVKAHSYCPLCLDKKHNLSAVSRPRLLRKVM